VPYFIDSMTRTVVVRAPGIRPKGDSLEVGSELAREWNLVGGRVLTAAEFQAIREAQSGCESVRSTRSPAAQRANTIAGIVEVASWLFLLGFLVLGVAVASQHEYESGAKAYPYLVEGIAVAVVGSFQCLVVLMVASYIKARLSG
jgi:hypothetical protein